MLRTALASLLPKMNSILDHPALCALMRSPDAGLRSTAASVLTQVGAKTAFELLSEMVREPGLESHREIVGVLVAIGEHRAVAALHAALAFGTPEDKVYTIDQLASPRCMARDATAAARAIASATRGRVGKPSLPTRWPLCPKSRTRRNTSSTRRRCWTRRTPRWSQPWSLGCACSPPSDPWTFYSRSCARVRSSFASRPLRRWRGSALPMSSNRSPRRWGTRISRCVSGPPKP